MSTAGKRSSDLTGLRSLALQTEQRIGRLERAVFLSEDDVEQPSIVALGDVPIAESQSI